MSHLSRGGIVDILDDDGCARRRISGRTKGKAEGGENKDGREGVGGQRRRTELRPSGLQLVHVLEFEMAEFRDWWMLSKELEQAFTAQKKKLFMTTGSH